MRLFRVALPSFLRMINNLLLILALAGSGGAPCSPAIPQSADGNYLQNSVAGNIPYAGDFTLDAYAPAGEPRPAAIIIHGSHGNKRTHVTPLFELLDRAGYAWFSVDYHSEADVAKAIRFIRCPGRFNISNDLTLVAQESGAQIALQMAGEGDVARVVTIGAKLDPAQLQPLPPGTRVLMIQGTAEPGVPAEVVEGYCNKLVDCRYFPVPGEGYEIEHWHPTRWGWKEIFIAWLRGDRRGLWKDITYSRPEGRPLLMDAFIPSGPGPFPAVIMAHGGGWETGDKVTSLSPLLEPLARAGFAWFSIDHRLVPYVHIPDELEDFRAAIRFVRTHPAWFHVDPDRLAILGESSSGHLVAQLASEPCPGCEVRAVVSFYGVYDLTRLARDPQWKPVIPHWFSNPGPETLRDYSPIFHISTAMAPLLIIQGTDDSLYQGTLEYEAELKKAHTRHELIVLEGAPHGMEDWEGHPEWMSYKSRMVQWLSTVLAADAVRGSAPFQRPQ